MSTVITMTNAEFENIHSALFNANQSIGKYEFSKSLFARDGVNLRLEAYVQFEAQTVIDQEAIDARNEARAKAEQELNDAAAKAGLSVKDYKAQLESQKRIDRINKMVEERGIEADEAASIVDAEIAADYESKKKEFMDYKTSNPETADYEFNEDDFQEWKEKYEYNSQTIPTKKVVSVFLTREPGVVYSFDESVTGIAGFSTIASDKIHTEYQKVPTVEEIKTRFKQYIESSEFIKGLAFVGRIAGDAIEIKVED